MVVRSERSDAMPSPENTMEATPRRRFTIADGMILVAATALALVELGLQHAAWEPTWDSVAPKATWAGLVFTFALVAIRLRLPRPGRDDLWRQPGWVACASVSIVLAVLLLEESLRLARNLVLMPQFALHFTVAMVLPQFLDRLPRLATLVIVAAWSILALGGRWKAEAGWIDRTGRLIGVLWIAINLVNWFMPWFY